jgi:hypothetical protein
MWKQFRLMAPEGGASGGGGEPPAAAPAAAPPAAVAPPAVPRHRQLQLPSEPALASRDQLLPPRRPQASSSLQEKFHVKTADGKLDEAASIAQTAEGLCRAREAARSTENCRRRAPPSTRSQRLRIIEPAAFEGFLKDPATVAALDGMHKLGLNNTQVDAVMQMYLESARQLAAGGPALSAEDTITELRKEWKTEAELSKNIGAARHAATALGTRVGLDFAAIEAAGLANNPTFIRMMTALAPELGEDRAPSGSALPANDLDSLVKSKAYMDPNDPNHKAVKEKVAQHFASLPGGANKPRGPVTISP